MKAKRQSAVEPVFGSLINHLGIRKMNTIGIRQANKNMLMAAVAYNLKKYLNYARKIVVCKVNEAKNLGFELITYLQNVLRLSKHLIFSVLNSEYLRQDLLKTSYIELLKI